jgi:hypothetical protein
MVADPFFLFKNPLSPNKGPYNSASIDVKNGSPDPADFAKTRRLCWLQYTNVAQPFHELPEPRKMDHRLVAVHAKKTRWQMLAVRAIVWATLAYRSCLSAICQGTLRDMPKLKK